MKKSFYLWAAIAVMVTGCNIKSSHDMKKETDEILRKFEQDMDVLTNSLYRGGQPGKITVQGVVVKMASEQMQLDERITVAQVGGKGNRGVSQTLVSDKNRAELIEAVPPEMLSQIDESETFINLGCDDLSESDTDGLTAKSADAQTDSVLSLRAKKIFICGSQTVSQSFVIISADQLILKHAVLEVKSSAGSLSVSANKIWIEGKNSLKTSGLDRAINVLDAPSLELVVKSEIHGEGTLALHSDGGNCVQKDEKQ